MGVAEGKLRLPVPSGSVSVTPQFGRGDPARADARQCRDACPSLPLPRLDGGNVPDPARGTGRSFRATEPDATRDWSEVGLACAEAGDAAGAEVAFRRATVADPGDVRPAHNHAVALAKLGRHAEAANALRSVV
ncbi:MAG: hypothetical protein JWO31_3273, partial [Phycisphaerales bacterium]|nr:hypothetical protein [Phycisphaerales bacterium]